MVLAFVIIISISGCSYFTKSQLGYNDNTNDLKREEINLSLESIANNLTEDDSKALVSDLNKLKFYASDTFEAYSNKIISIKEKYKENAYCYDYVCLLDSNVSKELVLENKLEARHLIENAITILKKKYQR